MSVVTEVQVGVRAGGKLQLVKYEQSADYQVSMSRTLSGEWTTEEADKVQTDLYHILRQVIEPLAQGEYEELHAAREALNS